MSLRFAIGSGKVLDLRPTRLVVAGWTGRNAAAIAHHIDELAALGVPRPSATPLYYRIAHQQLTQSAEIEVLGDASSGEVEPVLLRAQGRWWLTVGSDHTDRAAEAYAVDVSKQMCAKPLARDAWPWDNVAAHADTLQLRSEIFEDGRWVPYQQGTVAAMRPLMDLVQGLPKDAPVADGLVLFCGTLAALPDAQGRAVRPAARMRLELADPGSGQRIVHEYRTVVLPRVA